MTTLKSKNLVNIEECCPNIVLDIRYATTNNLTGRQLYKKPRCFLHEKVAKELCNIQCELEKQGYGIKIWDAYRPVQVQEKLVKFVNNSDFTPSVSNHSKGIAVDLTIIRLSNGHELEMPTEFDDLTEKAYENYADLSQLVINNREKLKTIMAEHGFTVYPYEWWHYDFLELQDLEALDIEI